MSLADVVRKERRDNKSSMSRKSVNQTPKARRIARIKGYRNDPYGNKIRRGSLEK